MEKEAWDPNAAVGQWLDDTAAGAPRQPPGAPAFPSAPPLPPLPPYTTPPDLLSAMVKFRPPVRMMTLYFMRERERGRVDLVGLTREVETPSPSNRPHGPYGIESEPG